MLVPSPVRCVQSGNSRVLSCPLHMCESSTQAREYNTPSTPRRAWIIHSWSSQSPLCLNPECQTSDSDFTAACVSRYRVLSSLTCAPMWQEKSTFSWLWTLVWEEKSSTPNLTKNVTMQNCFRPLACSCQKICEVNSGIRFQRQL